jgi:hypothetical protein
MEIIQFKFQHFCYGKCNKLKQLCVKLVSLKFDKPKARVIFRLFKSSIVVILKGVRGFVQVILPTQQGSI